MDECRHAWEDVTREVKKLTIWLCRKCNLQQTRGALEDLVIEAERQLGKPSLSWTTEMPTKPGCYWWRRAGQKVVYIVEVNIEDQTVSSSGTADDASLDEMVGDQWAGPLEPPAE